IAGSAKRRAPPGQRAVTPPPQPDPPPTFAGAGPRPDAPVFSPALPRAAPEEGRSVSPRCRVARPPLAVPPALAGTLRRIGRAPTRLAPHPGPARGAQMRPAVRMPARASLAPLLPLDELHSQALHSIADSRLDRSKGNPQPVGDLLLSVSAVVGQHDCFTLFRREGHQSTAYCRALEPAEGLLHHVGAATCARVTFRKRLDGTNSLTAQRVDGSVMGQRQYPGTGTAAGGDEFARAAPDVEENLLCDFLGSLRVAEHSDSERVDGTTISIVQRLKRGGIPPRDSRQ